ncbi:hypothetical protein IHV09_22070 [Fictibacillus sp. 23RED33]|uniref:hypothetical protein n=1 Tax=Fictibacillus sp. 23RED33 TaxID=2745879 RepID=UPI0018CF7796|nr:hypothetical protein [Fictibacillus sp. 23RED33]MBH0176247.1 hypothetical protein [Fictibacillus sp. 23RED33]
MKTYIKEEFKRAFISKNTAISLILCIICILVGSFESFYLFGFLQNNAFNLFMLSYSEGTSAILSTLFPLIVSIPFVSSYLSDVNSGLINYIVLKTGRLKYLTIKLIVNGVVGGSVIAGSLFFSFIIYLIVTGFSKAELSNSTVVFGDIYQQNPVLYIYLLILNSFICGMCFSTFGIGMSTLLKNKYLSVIFPFLFYIFSGTILLQINKLFNSVITYDLNFYYDLKYTDVLLYQGLLFLIGISLFYSGAKINEEQTV